MGDPLRTSLQRIGIELQERPRDGRVRLATLVLRKALASGFGQQGVLELVDDAGSLFGRSEHPAVDEVVEILGRFSTAAGHGLEERPRESRPDAGAQLSHPLGAAQPVEARFQESAQADRKPRR